LRKPAVATAINAPAPANVRKPVRNARVRSRPRIAGQRRAGSAQAKPTKGFLGGSQATTMPEYPFGER